MVEGFVKEPSVKPGLKVWKSERRWEWQQQRWQTSMCDGRQKWRRLYQCLVRLVKFDQSSFQTTCSIS